jgi:type IV pilus assembly protein PilE
LLSPAKFNVALDEKPMTVLGKVANVSNRLMSNAYVSAASHCAEGKVMAFKKSRQHGMTLLELMIVIAIVGILASIAMPSFNNSVMKARRADARNSMFDWQLRQAEYFSNNLSYDSVDMINGGGADTVDSGEGYYDITVSSASTTAFEMIATPKSGSSQASDSDCASYFCINQDGPLYTGDCAPQACW